MPTSIDCSDHDGNDTISLTIQVALDYWAIAWNETRWQLTNWNNSLLLFEDFGAWYDINDTIAEYETCLLRSLEKRKDCYVFEAFDQWGDGIDDSSIKSDGSNILIYLNDELIEKTMWNDGYYLKIEFCLS